MLSDKSQTHTCTCPFSAASTNTTHGQCSSYQCCSLYLLISFSPCVCDSEAPLFVDVIIEQHAAKKTRRVAWRKAGGDGGGRPPVSPLPLRLQQVLPQDLHQVFIQARVFGHGGHCQGVLVGHPHACLLGHACPGFTSTSSSTSQANEQRRQPSYIRDEAKQHRCFLSARVTGFPRNVSICKKKKNLKI